MIQKENWPVNLTKSSVDAMVYCGTSTRVTPSTHDEKIGLKITLSNLIIRAQLLRADRDSSCENIQKGPTLIFFSNQNSFCN